MICAVFPVNIFEDICDDSGNFYFYLSIVYRIFYREILCNQCLYVQRLLPSIINESVTY